MPGVARMRPHHGDSTHVSAHPGDTTIDAHIPQHEVKEETEDYYGSSYKPRPQLAKPGTYLRPLKFFINGLDKNEIDIDPEYQRDVVWTADRMSGLIDSLMENYYIPPVIINKKAPIEDGTKSVLVCVDGKQRLSSVRAFVKGMIPCHDHRGDKWWFKDELGSKKKNILSADIQKEFLDKEFVTFEYADLPPDQEEDLFARVQMGVQLTHAEKMRASTGPWQDLAKCFIADFPVIYSLLKDQMRAKDFQYTLSCFSQIVEVQHPTADDGIPMLKTSYTSLPKFLNNKTAVDDEMKSHLAGVWKTFQDLIELDSNTFTNADKRLKGVQTFAPVEMVAVTVLISMYSETRNNQLLLGDIRALRDYLRENFTDLRINGHVWKAVWKFMNNLENIRGAVDGTTVDRSAPSRPAPQPRAPASASPGVKNRGRPTARTKPPSLTATSGASETKVEPDAPISSTDRPPKRQRTDSDSIPTSNQTAQVSSIPFRPTAPASRPVPVPDTTPKLAPFAALGSPVFQSAPPLAASAISTRKSQKARRNTPKNGRANASPANNPNSVSVPPSAQPITPSEVRQNRRSELNSYRAPVAPMAPGTSASPLSIQTSIQAEGAGPIYKSYWNISNDPERRSGSPAMPSPRSFQPQAGGSPFATAYTTSPLTTQAPYQSPFQSPSQSPYQSPFQSNMQDPTSRSRSSLSGPIDPASRSRSSLSGPIRPPSRTQELVLVSPVNRPAPAPPTMAPPNNAQRPKQRTTSIPQYDGAAIDLTQDDDMDVIENERVGLLSSFRATSMTQDPRSLVAPAPVRTQYTGPYGPMGNSGQAQTGIPYNGVPRGDPRRPQSEITHGENGYHNAAHVNQYQRLKERGEQFGDGL